jgi:hypothetical protein
MKVLLDENLDHRLRATLAPHEAFTVSFMGWAGFKNGLLLDVAEASGFDVLLTGDKTLYQEQNLTDRRIGVVAMSAVEWQIVKHHIRVIVSAIGAASPGTIRDVDRGTFSRKRNR